jgi:hypothetical protein
VLVRSARITLKQHRFEVGAGAVAMILVGAAALWVNTRMQGVLVPSGCLAEWMTGGPFQIRPECDGPVQQFLTMNEEEAGKVFAAMAVLPIAAGLLAGVTLVGRELESRTAQTAWGLAASRRKWFARQLWPILVVLAITVTFAASASSVLETTRRVIHSFPFMDLGLFGPIAVVRAFAALGIGLFVGAALGRTLPAFIVGAVLSFVLISTAGSAPWQWASSQPRVLLTGAEANSGIQFEQKWRAPDGTIISDEAAVALPAAENPDDYNQWLIDHGYQMVTFGITAETARGWEPIEMAGFAALGLVLVLGTLVVVDRRRPT